MNSSLKTKAEGILDPNDHQSYINGIVVDENYNQIIKDIINERFTNFNIEALNYDQLVSGKSNYSILEITPRSTVNDLSEISDLALTLNEVKSIYQTITIQNDYTNKNFIANMPNFNLDVMTIKQFVDNRDELDGKYDAIVFASGDYSKTQVTSCAFEPNPGEITTVQIYDQNHRLRYSGGTSNGSTNLETAIPHGSLNVPPGAVPRAILPEQALWLRNFDCFIAWISISQKPQRK